MLSHRINTRRLRLWFVVSVCGGSFLLIVLSAWIGPRVFPAPPRGSLYSSPKHLEGLLEWDGRWYAQIATTGYTYSLRHPSGVVFFPAYPMLAAALARITGLPVGTVLVLVSNVFLVLTCGGLAYYMQATGRDALTEKLTLAILLLFPTSFFFRMAYTESMFLFVVVLVMLGMRLRWPAHSIAVLIGIATATRGVGVALLLPFTVYLVANRRAAANDESRRSRGAARCAAYPTLFWTMVCLLLACWGLIAFMAFQFYDFGDCLAFMRAQFAWHVRPGPESVREAALGLLTCEPLRAVYDPQSPCYWRLDGLHSSPLLSLRWMNPVVFGVGVILTIVGAAMRWLSAAEVLLSASLIGMAYVVQGHRMCMQSQGRFVLIAFPVFIVMAHILARVPWGLRIYILGMSAAVMLTYAGLFASGYPML